MLIRTLLGLLIAQSLMAAASCSSEDATREDTTVTETVTVASQPESTPWTDETPVSIIGDPRWATRSGDSLAEMFSGYDSIVVAHVKEVIVPYDPRTGYLGIEHEAGAIDPLNKDKVEYTPTPEELARPPGRNYSVYAVEIAQVLNSGSVKEGDVVLVRHSGGTFEGVTYQFRGSPAFEIGGYYLIGLKITVPHDGVTPDHQYRASEAFAAFAVDADGRLRPSDPMWSELTAVRELNGLSIDEAAVKIGAALSVSDVD